MYQNIKKIEKTYTQPVFRFALSHLFNVGADRLLNTFYAKDDTGNGSVLNETALEEECKKIIAETPSTSLMTGSLLADVLRCAVMLAKYDVWELFKFIQTDIGISGVNVHPGTYMTFRRECDAAVITSVIIPPYADADGVNDAIDQLHSLSEISVIRNQDILDAFHAFGIRPSVEMPCDETVYL